MKLSTLRTLAVAATALFISTVASAQTLYLSTYDGTNLERYADKTLNVKASRQMFHGWNTISLPFNMTQAQVESVFGSDCKLEKLVGVEEDGAGIRLDFQSCNNEGIKANMPYILNYTGVNSLIEIAINGALVKNEPSVSTFTTASGIKVSFCGAQKQTKSEGLYGILARDNSDASFVNVSGLSTSFYATRCYIALSGANRPTLTINHIDAATNISAIVNPGEKVDVYSVSGVRMATSLSVPQIEALPAGTYLVKGKKVIIK